MKEEFRKIQGFSNYEISNLGRLKTFNWKNTGQERIMKPSPDERGYLKTVIVSDDKVYKTVAIHRLVAVSFLGEKPSPKHQVNHINGIKDDNRSVNLEWCTLQENIQHAIKTGLFDSCRSFGSSNGMSKATVEQVIDIRESFKPRVMTRKMLADKHGLTESCVKDILLRRTWKNV